MGNKNSKPTTTTSSANPAAMQAYSDLMARAQGVAAAPYTPFTGELTAPVNAEQQLGIGNINNYAGFGLPYIQQASQLASTAAQPLTPTDIQTYYNPNVKNVVDATQAQFNNTNAQQLQQVKGNAIAQGALGGNREAIAEAETANQQNLAQAPVIAGLYNNAYQNATQTALAAKNATEGGANLLGNLGVVGQNAGITGGTAQMGAGAVQQQTQQAQDTSTYQQFLNALAYPFQTTQWLSGIDTGVGSQMGGTSQTFAPPPSTLGQIAGGLTSGVGLLGATGAFGSAGWLASAMMAGGAVPSRGVENQSRHETVPENDDTLRAQQHQLLSGHRRVHMFPAGTRELSVPPSMARTERNGDVFHYDPRRIAESDIHGMSDNGRENDMLDLGPFSKHEVLQRMMGGEIPLAVVERNPHGIEVRAAAGTHITAPHQLAAMNRSKSPGNRVGLEDPRETIGARLRGSGGRIQGFADGGAPQGGEPLGVMPYAGAHSWVPSIQIARGSGAPRPEGVAPQPSLLQQASEIGKLAKTIQSGGIAPSDSAPALDQMGGAGLSASDENPSPYWSGGSVANHHVRGYDAGGTPSLGSMPYMYAPGVDSWIPTAQLAHGNTIPKAPGAPQPTKPQDISGLMALGHGIDWRKQGNNGLSTDVADNGSGIYTGDASMPGFANTVDLSGMGMSPEGLGWARGGVVRGYDAGGGAPYDENYFDETFYNPIQHDAQSYGILSKPAAMKDYSDRIIANSDYRPAVTEMPMPRARPAGLVPSYDLPPEITAGTSYPAPRRRSDVMSYGPADPAHDDVEVVEGGIAHPRANRFKDAADDAGREAYAQEQRASAPQGVAPKAGVNWGGDSNLWPSLISAGAAMMASRSPYAGVALGEGLGEGAKTYQSVRMNDQKIAHETKKLQQEADLARERLKVSTMPYTQMTAHEKAALEEQKRFHMQSLRKPQLYTDTDTLEQHMLFPKVGKDGELEWYDRNMKTGDVKAATPPDATGASTASPAAASATAPPQQPQQPQPQQKQTSPNPLPGETPSQTNERLVANGNYDYRRGAPAVEKGQDVPEPPESTLGRSKGVLKADAETFFLTGKAPRAPSGNSPIAQRDSQYSIAVKNYGEALAASRGMTPAQLAEAWRSAPGMLKFILGADGRSTVSLGTAVRHLDTMREYAKAWHEAAGRPDFPALNRIKAFVANNYGSAAATNLEAVTQIVGPELIKAIGVAGAGTKEEREKMEALFGSKPSAEQILGSIGGIQKLLAGQLEGKEMQAKASGLSEEKFRGLIGERPYELLKHAETGSASKKPTPTKGDIEYARAHPEVRSKFIERFGVEP